MLIQAILCFLVGYLLLDLQSCFGVWVTFARSFGMPLNLFPKSWFRWFESVLWRKPQEVTTLRIVLAAIRIIKEVQM